MQGVAQIDAAVSTANLSRRDLILLVILTLGWGLNWPIMKAGVQEFAPLGFRFLCMVFGLTILFVWARTTRQSLRVARSDWRTLAILAVPNVLIWHVFIIYGVKLLSSGRAAVLAYTMPIWVVLINVLIYRQALSGRYLIGALCTLTGVLALMHNELTQIAGKPLGLALTLTAAFAWGWGTVLIKRMPMQASTLAVTFWMLVMAMAVLGIGSALFERAQWQAPTALQWGSIAYNAVVAIAYAHVVWFHLARVLPPVASGLSVMMIPVVGVFSGAWLLGEQLVLADWIALAAISAAIASVLLPQPKATRAC
jgi:drug/metabolite transporter (DMT)-like permease